MKKRTLALAFFATAVAFSFCSEGPQKLSKAELDSAWSKLPDEEKRLPGNALLGLEAADGLEVTLFASEPMMGNPTNIDVDARGRVWVCEAYNYRPQLNPDNPQRSEGDRILILEDTNSDGKADTAKVFYQGTDVNAALGVAVLGNKVIVSCSPNVFLFTDTNGDDKADTREILFSHVGGEQHDHAVHSFSFGPDGKLYFNFGNEGQQLQDKSGKPLKDKDGKVINAEGSPYRQGMVFRMNEDGSEIEVLAHNFRNNFEAAVDAYGTIWQSDNDDDGNQGTRINYVMQWGNYGYTDEMTGAGWRAQRTGMEAEIPARHWHQNDPGSIPNLLFTGAGSPTGMVVYEGNLLPEVYRDQIIHCDAGPNIVRAYPVEADGAGYKAKIVPLLEGVRDQWFRPSDVCVAPDGSLFVADWYDPGVGGHQMGDMNRGRVYRIAPPGKKYNVPQQDLATAEGSAKALQSPNIATRYLAWQKLHDMGAAAEPALKDLYKSENPRMQARAFWLLAKLPGKGGAYIAEAAKDKNSNIRITALRAAVQSGNDVVPIIKQLSDDANPQVRREAALALRHNASAELPQLWTQLALQYDGKDRWYLEALGIGADGQWDRILPVWKEAVGQQISSAAAHNIVWRARSGLALPLLATTISNDAVSEAERLKAFRAFDFIEHPAKEAVLLALLDDKGPHRQQIMQTALAHLDPKSIGRSPKVKAALYTTLDSVRGTQEFINLAGRYGVKDQNEELLQIALARPDSSLGVEATNLLLRSGGAELLQKAINSPYKEQSAAALAVLGRAGSGEAMRMMQAIIVNNANPLPTRQEAVKILAGGWMESEQLLSIIKSGKLAKELQPTAAVALAGAFRKDIRQEALKYLGGATAKEGGELPPINVLAQQPGNAAAGKSVYTTICATCHKVGAEGAAFGPALSQIGSKLPKEALYMAILHPDQGISFGYEGYVFKLKDGSAAAGVVSSETETEVELALPGGIKKRMEKAQIASRSKMEASMMPSNLQAAMSKDELINLVAYLASLKGEKAK